jgi:hypothetical protein
MDRCPNCRARYQEGARCRRCRMELGQLLAAEAAADRFLCQALATLAEDDTATAVTMLNHARALRNDLLLDLLLGFATEPPAQPRSASGWLGFLRQ